MRGVFRRLLRIAAPAAILVFALLAASAPARAHATLVSADPADGIVLSAKPAKLWLTFSENVKPLQLQLTLPSGEVLPLSPAVTGKTLVVDAPDGIGTGTHFLSWRVVSEDGHPIGGTVLFSVDRVTANAAEMGETRNTQLRLSIWLAKILLYAALFLGIGGAFFRVWIDDGKAPASNALVALLLTGLAVAVASLGLQGLDVLGRGFDEILDRATWHAAWRTSYATTILVAAASLGAGLLSLVSSALGTARALSMLAVMGAGLALAASGHASSASPQWLTRPAVFAHGVAITLWIGALIPLGFLLWREPARAAAPLQRFSRIVPVAVALLVISGFALAIVQLEALNALWTTEYGLVLVRKLVVLLPVFALAALNRWWFTARADAPRSARAMAGTIAVETLLIVVVLGIVASWRFTPPPRALTLANSTTMVHVHTSKAMAEVTIRPDAAGPVSVSILIMTGDFAPLEPKEVTLSLALPSAGIEPIRRTATVGADGLWTVEGLVVPAPGRWSLRLDILISDFETVALEQPIEIGLPR